MDNMSRNSLNKTNDRQSLLERSDNASDDNIKTYDIEELIDEADGFGKYQWLLLLYVVITYSGVNMYSTNLPYFELMPALKCNYTAEPQEGYQDCHDSKDV